MNKPTRKSAGNQHGQSMVEYTLIVVLVVFAFAAAIAATGPAIGNVFSNTVYNLLGQDPNEIDDLPDKEGFWLTVTWVSQQTPVEEPLPTRTLPPPTKVPTAGPSPTNTPVTPTKTPTPTYTPPPTNTPQDFEFIAPWHDSADEVDYWRLDEGVFLGADRGWYAEFFTDPELTNSATGDYTADLYGEDKAYVLDYDWGSGSPIDGWPVGSAGDDFGISFRRVVTFTQQQTLIFTVPDIDNGGRIWLVPISAGTDITTFRPTGCTATGVSWGGTPSTASAGSREPDIYDDAHPTFSDDCLLMDGWYDGFGSENSQSFTRTVNAGSYMLVVDMYEKTGSTEVSVNISAVGRTGNPDNTLVDGSGNPTSGLPDCRWNTQDSSDANSLESMFDAWSTGDYIGEGTRCYLELRGSVEIPSELGLTNPVLSFWDVWDLRDPTLTAWVEVADYDPNNDNVFNRADLVWQRQDLHVGDTTNFNWTYQHIDLRTLMGIGAGVDLTGKKYTIRFGMQNVNNGSNASGYRLWYVDSVNLDVETMQTFVPNKTWTLDEPDQENDFIASGRWQLSTAITRGGAGMSWDDSYLLNYDRMRLDRYDNAANEYDDVNARMHTLEFKGIIDIDDPSGVVDEEGDTGDALLSFWHAYDLHRYTGLEVQYTTDLTYDTGNSPVWKVVPGGDFVVRNSSSTSNDSFTMVFEEVNLQEIKNIEGTGRFRLRFAMVVNNSAGSSPGWYIDEIKLERKAISRFIEYPFVELAEDEESVDDWIMSGTWDRVGHKSFRPINGVGFSFHDSPNSFDSGGNEVIERYDASRTTTVELKGSFDIKNDSQTNPRSPACTLVPSTLCDEDDNPVPNDPVLTFWWWHDFGQDGGEDFYLEWKKADDSDTVWKELWVYRDRMYYNSATEWRSRRVWNWERVEVDLRQLLASSTYGNGLPTSDTDDDIRLRFRFETNSSTSTNSRGDGVYIDEIRIQDRVERTWALWDSGVSESVDVVQYPTNEPLIYTTGNFRYVRMVAKSSVNNNPWASMAEFNLLDNNGNTIPRSGWSIVYYDSQQNSSHAATNILDGNTSSIWHTQWSPSNIPQPHEFQINLGANYKVAHFKTLPRQDGSTNGRILDYDFYVSTNGSTWQLAKQGTLDNTAVEQTISLQIDYTTNTPPPGSGTTETVVGDGVSYRDNLDDNAAELFDNWHLGGEWNVVSWEHYDGVLSFHDSTSSPWNSGEPSEVPPPNTSNYTPQNGYGWNVLEMATIIDMRATQDNRKPVMTFWQRHQIGSAIDLRVQISYENPGTIGTSSYCFSSGRDQCYEHLYGWSEWETAPPWGQTNYNDWDIRGTSRQYLWKREIVDLSPYAASGGSPGKRIRIRFITDTNERAPGDNQLMDGWYIDNIELKYNVPAVVNIDVDTGESFYDAARNTRNWLIEGKWGLSPELFRGGGGGPADFGGSFWNYWLYNMGSCSNNKSLYVDCVRNRFNSWSNPDSGVAYQVKKGLVLDINNDWGDGGPTPSVISKFAGIWELVTPVIGTTMNAGNYTFVFTYDEGLRARYDTYPTPGGLTPTTEVPDPYDPFWNIYNDFNTGGRQINIGNALFESGEQYKLRLEYLEYDGDAAFIMSLGSSSFSFTDSPKVAAGAAFPEIPAAPRSQSSLIFNGVFNLQNAVEPILQYYTYYEIGGNGQLYVEVTTDGGFIWTQEGLQGVIPSNFWVGTWRANLWNDSLRTPDGKMAFDRNTYTFLPAVYPPAYTNVNFGTDLNYNWGGGSPVSGWVNDNWSGQFRRRVHLDQQRIVTFRIQSDDGHRMWIDYGAAGGGFYDGCEFYYPDNPDTPLISGRPSTYDDRVFDDPSGSCMLIDDWEDNGNNDKTVTRTLPAGDHELIIDFYENGGGAKLILDVTTGDFDSPSYDGVYMPDDGDWLRLVHSLQTYAGAGKPPVGLRFRLDRLGEDEGGNYQQQDTQTPINWMESWWITDISVLDTVSG